MRGLKLGELARIWQAGCIIRAQFLGRIKAAYDLDAALPNLLLDPSFRDELATRQDGWRSLVARGATAGLTARPGRSRSPAAPVCRPGASRGCG